MIVYNNRKDGPIEYDKFILNTFQMANNIDQIISEEIDQSNSACEIVQCQTALNNMYKYVCGDSNNIGLSEELYYEKMLYLEK